MRVVIVQPSLEDFYTTPHRLSALGGFSVKAILEKRGYQAELLNFPLFTKKPPKKPLPPWADHVRPHIIGEGGPLSYFTGWYRWGPETDEAARIIHDRSPDLILISLFAHAYAEEVPALARACKSAPNRNKDVTVAVGGAGVTVRPEYFARESSIDLVLSGEGEVLFADYSPEDLIAEAAAGRRVLKSDRFCSSEDMVPVFSHTTGGKRHLQAATLLSRGCPRGCRFCSNRLTQGTRVRRLDPDTASDAFRIFLRKPETEPGKKLTLDLEDDNLLLDKSYFLSVLNGLRSVWEKEGRREDLFFTAENGVDYELLDSSLLKEMIRRGFRQFNFSLASAEKSLLDRENRFFAPEKLRAHLELLGGEGIPAVTYFICGLQGDSRDSIAEALSLLCGMNTRVGISLFYPVPGLEGFTGSDPYGGLPVGLSRGSMAYPWNGSLSTKTLITAFRLSRLVNLLKDDTGLREEHRDLIDTVFREKRLYTYDRHKKKIPVPYQDRDLVTLVTERITYR